MTMFCPLLLLMACAPPEVSSLDTAGGEVESHDPPMTRPGPTDSATTATSGIQPMSGFSFVDDHLAGMPRPYGDDVVFLAAEGITLLVGLRLDPADEVDLAIHGIDYLHLPIEDFHAPTLQQQLDFVQAAQQRVAAGEHVGVHCTAGLGRTGTMLATWFVAGGMEPLDAIEHVRTLRPGSIETAEQEEAVARFAAATR